MTIIRHLFGHTLEGKRIELFVLTNRAGLEASIMTYGGTLVALKTPDRQGRIADIVLGFDSLPPYLAGHPYFGSLIGRYGNRIAQGQFALHGQTYLLTRNEGPHHLHGGIRGFDKVVWEAHPKPVSEGVALELHYLSREGEEGYPGNLDVTVIYTLTEGNELRIDYTATTDRPTVVNLTQHTYFNLDAGDTILGHRLRLAAEYFLPIDRDIMPMGIRYPVRMTPMDFTQPTPIGARINADDEQLRFAHGGYDHTWILDEQRALDAPVAEVYGPESGRLLTVTTTQPGIQCYSGNFLDGRIHGKAGKIYGKHAGLCLEAQHFPNSPNVPDFPSTVLVEGGLYRQTTVYRLTIDR